MLTLLMFTQQPPRTAVEYHQYSISSTSAQHKLLLLIARSIGMTFSAAFQGVKGHTKV